MHAVVFSPQAERVRAFFADVLGMASADAGGGWLIFALPPAELAVHPSGGETGHELYLMCDDVHGFVRELAAKGFACGEVQEERWGSLTHLTLPGGGKLGVYQPRHPSPLTKRRTSAAKKVAKRPKAKAKKSAAKKRR